MIRNKKNLKTYRRRNPHDSEYIKNIIGDTNYKYLDSGSYAHTYKFILKFNRKINNINFKPGEYLLKIFYDPFKYPQKCKERFLKLSKFKLIPKIYIINKIYIIMDYVDGITLKKLLPEYNNKTNAWDEKIPPR